MNKLKAINSFIFGGSASIAMLQNNIDLCSVLEISDNMINENAYHFHKNYPDINIIKPSVWENDDYLKNIKDIDIMFNNPPCSSLSQINRNASVNGKSNKHFYRVINILKLIKPKSFIIENAPTLIKLGYPILMDIVKELKDVYNFTVIRDYAGNHSVPMKRMRTLIIGYNKEYFKLPILQMNKQNKITVKNTLQDLYNVKLDDIEINNFNLIEEKYQKNNYLYKYIDKNKSFITSLALNFDNIKDKINDDKLYDLIYRNKIKLDNGKNIFDKSSYKLDENGLFPSMTSLSSYIHPTKDRTLTIREYARIMGYPDDFVFYPNECKTPLIQCIAQGVPVNFVKYITNEVKEVFNNNREFINDEYMLCYQEHTTNKAKLYTFDDLLNNNELNTNDCSFKLEK